LEKFGIRVSRTFRNFRNCSFPKFPKFTKISNVARKAKRAAHPWSNQFFFNRSWNTPGLSFAWQPSWLSGSWASLSTVTTCRQSWTEPPPRTMTIWSHFYLFQKARPFLKLKIVFVKRTSFLERLLSTRVCFNGM